MNDPPVSPTQLADDVAALLARAREGKKCGRCYGSGQMSPYCGECGDSTWDHNCPADEPCTDCGATGRVVDPIVAELATALGASAARVAAHLATPAPPRLRYDGAEVSGQIVYRAAPAPVAAPGPVVEGLEDGPPSSRRPCDCAAFEDCPRCGRPEGTEALVERLSTLVHAAARGESVSATHYRPIVHAAVALATAPLVAEVERLRAQQSTTPEQQSEDWLAGRASVLAQHDAARAQLAEVTRERDEARADAASLRYILGGSTSDLIAAKDACDARRCERDAAIARAEAAERERDELVVLASRYMEAVDRWGHAMADGQIGMVAGMAVVESGKALAETLARLCGVAR